MKWLLVAILMLVALSHAPSAYAAAAYFEFHPDYAQSLLVASSDTVFEVFLPLNEYLAGFDFWVSTAGQTGDATFTLLDPSGAELASRTVPVPAIADSAGGTRLHIDLPSQLAVTGNSAYSIRISTAMPTLRLYYANQNRLLAHNASPAASYSGGLARIGSQDEQFSFTFALYENAETAAPVLSNVSVSQPAVGQTTLSFNANEPVDWKVTYNTSVLDWTGSYSSCQPQIQTCTVSLPVSPGTDYTYTLAVRDSWGNHSGVSGTFTSLGYGQTPVPTASVAGSPAPSPSGAPITAPTPDTTPLSITGLRIAGLAARSAGFAWTTNKAANATVVVQLTPVLITAGGNSDGTLELEHLITVGTLTPDTYYQATVTSVDGAGLRATATATFLTPKETPASPPSSNPSPTPAPSGGPSAPPPLAQPGSGAGPPGVQWSPPAGGEPKDGYRVDVFDSQNKLIKTITIPAGTHTATLTGLVQGQHRVIVYAKHDGVYEKVAAPTTITVRTKPPAERLALAAPYILGALVLAIASTVGVLALRKPRAPMPPATPPAPMTGAMPNPPGV